MPARESWRVRVVLNRYHSNDAAEVAAKLRESRSFDRRNITRRDWQVVVVRNVPLEHARDTLSAMIHTLDVLYRQWPEGHRLPHGGESVSVRYVKADEEDRG